METLTCPKCNFLREPQAVDCPACGIVFAKYQKTLEAASAAPPVPQAVNPYAAPQSDTLPPPLPGPQPAAVPAGVWRHEGLLIIQQGVDLPSRCVTCNRSTVHRWRRTFYWAPPGLRILVIAPLLYIIVILVVRKSATLSIPLCEEHEEKRRTQTRNSWLVGLGGVALFVVSFFALGDDNGAVFGLLFLIGLIALIAGAVLSGSAIPLQPQKIDGYYAFMKKAGDDFLRSLPSAPMGIGM